MNLYIILSILLPLALAQSPGKPFPAASAANLDQTNALRQTQGLAALARDAKLDRLAMVWSKHMYDAQRMYHSKYPMAENVAAA